MDQPIVAQYKPYRIDVEEGETYLWCSCGLSGSQPFCDKSHVGTDFRPLRFQATESRTLLFCGCKYTRGKPLCDGSHNDLTEEYAGDDRPLEELLSLTEEVAFDPSGRAMLDGDCYVQKPDSLKWVPEGGLQLAPLITGDDNAKHLGQYYARMSGGNSEPRRYPGSDVVLFGVSGRGEIRISGRAFGIEARTGVHVRADESFEVSCGSGEELSFLVTVCPGHSKAEILTAPLENFAKNYPERAFSCDDSKRNSMADRFYQVLVGEDTGSAEVSQFIGEVPKSKAAPHRHLYEEALIILSASGVMWTETRRASVETGDIIFLPAEQEHSLECTEDSGMVLAGHFYPSGEPNINY